MAFTPGQRGTNAIFCAWKAVPRPGGGRTIHGPLAKIAQYTPGRPPGGLSAGRPAHSAAYFWNQKHRL
ncbi:hypothetical protein MGG_16991 [Pyricularia oryzae 70-15]|uniref:Uncharacterized protein n=2 Tax=Pyricularia oryzae TaxID=318829 RepID=G4N3A8_PYRO7|nr:uncharacterized protein MGG_16991 [Pyricularia oryzae 70-15]EHA53453.1 hypothetical protein MGG_16991 [Pyricularia oryzae 70-15]KAI7910703.1 hypothetical protein M9X92_010932 [Pyricularia oryzae]